MWLAYWNTLHIGVEREDRKLEILSPRCTTHQRIRKNASWIHHCTIYTHKNAYALLYHSKQWMSNVSAFRHICLCAYDSYYMISQSWSFQNDKNNKLKSDLTIQTPTYFQKSDFKSCKDAIWTRLVCILGRDNIVPLYSLKNNIKYLVDINKYLEDCFQK